MELNNNIQTLFSTETSYHADSVEWCPHAPYQHLFVCANYQLLENETSGHSKRVGKLLLFSIHPENGLELLQTLNESAILDQKWCHKKINDSILLGVADADHKVVIYKLNENTVELQLLTSCDVDSDSTETLVLSLDWSNGIYENNPEIICSDSKGNLNLLKINEDLLEINKKWHGHDYEAWIAGFYYWDTNIIFSGGDDSVFLKFDKRVGDQPISKNKLHEAGVTSFHSNLKKEYVIASGSYDEHVRLWDIRKIKSAIDTVKMPGTLWRLKWDPFSCTKLLAACMLGGVHILNASCDKLEIIGSYYDHQNITYGADWSFLCKEECSKYNGFGQHIISSCSFYDRKLCVSKFNFIT